MSRKITLALVALLLLCALLFALRGQLVGPALERIVSQAMVADVRDNLAPGLAVGVCGAGGPMPDPIRSGPCLVITAGENLLLVDAGTNGPRNLNRMQLPIGDVDAVLLTHFHSDHIDGLGELGTLRWVSAANTQPLPVIAPRGVEPVVDGFNLAYAKDARYRAAHHGVSVAPLSGNGLTARPFDVPEAGNSTVVWDQDGLRVIAFQVNHEPVKPAVGYRFDYGGRSVVVSGDTARSENLELFSRDVDLLLHDALSPELVGILHRAAGETGNAVLEKITLDIPDYHASPTDAAASAAAVAAEQLVLYHIVPPLVLPGMDKVFLDGVADIYSGKVSLAQDGMLFSLPADSSDILEIKSGL
jgi:ribonuclease Z